MQAFTLANILNRLPTSNRPKLAHSDTNLCMQVFALANVENGHPISDNTKLAHSDS
jgi:hypothetical protein